MKVIILAGGKGTRMKHLTKYTPKPLVKINEKPFITYLLDNLSRLELNEIGIVSGYKITKMRNFVKEYSESSNLNMEVIYQKKQLGTAHALSICKDFVDNDNFMLINGDGLFSFLDILSLKNNTFSNIVCGIHSQSPEKYGVLKCNNVNRLIEIVEKPETYVGDLISVGMYKFSPQIFDILPDLQPSKRGELELTDAINILANKDLVYIQEIKNYWIDMGCPEDVEKIKSFFDKKA